MLNINRKLAVFLSAVIFTLVCMVFVTFYLDANELRKLTSIASARKIRSRAARLFGGTIPREDLPLCPQLPDHLDHKVDPEKRLRELNVTVNRSRILDGLVPGGSYIPPDCRPRHNTAILVPYRNRPDHLRKFLLYMHAFLQKQKIQYTIFITEQTDNSTFNTGLLHNVGFALAERTTNFTCYVIHDVDLLPVNETHIYKCTDVPQHYCHINTKYGTKGVFYGGYFGGVVAFTRRQYNQSNGYSNIFFGWGGEDDEFMRRVFYPRFFGGVQAMTRAQYMQTNGFSNLFFGWGAEDDEFLKRVEMSGYNGPKKWTRVPAGVGYYYSLEHGRDKGNSPNPHRMKLIGNVWNRWKTEGLNSLHKLNYTLAVEWLDMYTRVLVDVNQKAIYKTYKSIFDPPRKPAIPIKNGTLAKNRTPVKNGIPAKATKNGIPAKTTHSGKQTKQARASEYNNQTIKDKPT